MAKVLFAIIILVSCSHPKLEKPTPEVMNFIPTNSIAYDSVPIIYNQWWNEISNCAKIKDRSLQIIQWFSVPTKSNVTSFECLTIFCWGWWRMQHEIYIVQGRELDEKLVKHEMLHELLFKRNLFTKDFKHHKLFAKCKV